jgi:hypothetical protein
MLVDSSISASQSKQNNTPNELLTSSTPILNKDTTLSFNATISTINSDLTSSLNQPRSVKINLNEKKITMP